MFDFISHITSTFGKRDCGSQGEKDAINYMAKEATPYADTVTTEKYDVHTLAFMGWIYITVTLILGAFVAAFFMPMLSIILIAVGMEIMILEFVLYRKVVDKLFPKCESLNMMAIKKPTGEVKRRVLISGHADAAAYTEGGFKSVCVTAMNFNLPRYYHTRLDVAEDVDKDCLANTFAILCNFVEKIDEQTR